MAVFEGGIDGGMGAALAALLGDQAWGLSVAMVRLRTAEAQRCVSRATLPAMVYKLELCTEKNRRRKRDFRHLADVSEKVRFIDGVKEETIQQHQQVA